MKSLHFLPRHLGSRIGKMTAWRLGDGMTRLDGKSTDPRSMTQGAVR